MAKDQPKDLVRETDERLAKAFLDKSARGEKATQVEFYAFRRVKKIHDRAARLEAFDSVTQAEWKEWSGRQAKIVNEQGRRYGAPFAAAKFSIRAVARWLHDFLAAHHQQLNRPPVDPVELKIKEQQLRRLQRQNEIADGRLVDPEELRDGLMQLGLVIRDVGERLQKAFGPGAGEMLIEALGDYERILQTTLGASDETKSPSPTA